jgi:hypothetical protein
MSYYSNGQVLDDRGSIPGMRSDFSLRHHAQTGSGIHPVSYIVGTEGAFPEDIATGKWISITSSIQS